MEDIEPSPTTKGLDTPSDREAAFELNLVKTQEKPIILQINENDACNDTGIFAHQASSTQNFANEASISQNFETTGPLEEAINETQREDANEIEEN